LADILCICVSLCECACSEPFNQTVAVLNANSSKMVKNTDFKFDIRVCRLSLYMIP